MIRKETDVRLLTYNFFLRPYLIKSNKSDFKSARLDLFIKEIHNYDIVCMQEMFDSYTHRQLKVCTLAALEGFEYFARSPSPKFTSKHLIDGGLLVLSKLPIEMTDFHEFAIGILSETLPSKGVLYVKIRLDGHYLHLFVTHTHTYYDTDDKVKNMVYHYVRMQHIAEMKEYIDMILETGMEPNDIAILAGDLNTDANSVKHPIHNYGMFFNKPNLSLKEGPELLENEFDLLHVLLNNFKTKFPAVDLFHSQRARRIVTIGDIKQTFDDDETPLVS